jgi:hypothetical protein
VNLVPLHDPKLAREALRCLRALKNPKPWIADAIEQLIAAYGERGAR